MNRNTSNNALTLTGMMSEDTEIIADVKVRKLRKKKTVIAPFGKKLGLNIQHVPSLGIGVNTVHYSSCMFTKVTRGDIFCEFMGQQLHNVTAAEFVDMIKRVDNKNDRRLIIEYTAADLKLLWRKDGKIEF